MMNRKDLSYEEEKSLFDELKELVIPHKIIVPELITRYSVLDKDGKRISGDERYSHSKTLNAHNNEVVKLCGGVIDNDYFDSTGYEAGKISLKEWSGVVAAVFADIEGSQSSENFCPSYKYSTTTHPSSVVIGTDNTAEVLTDYMLLAIIDHGTGAGEMEWQAPALISGWNVGSSYYYARYIRNFENNSGNSITVNEMGLVLYSNAGDYYLMVRDVIAGGQAVADGEVFCGEYEWRLTYP